uniref:F-box domain-containing protein n=1 Tax=Kalanchoe fedtschenkoi TaxID=63787 RepID=A0A7N0V5Q1_KALFE
MRIRRRFFSATIRTRCRLNLGETTLDRTSYIFQILIVEMVFGRSRLFAFIESMNYQIPNAKAGRVTGIQTDILVDRISDLPDNVLDCIMSKLTLLDAVRTSVVSKKWRHCWTWARKLEFDIDFFRDVIYNKNLELSNVVDSVLTQHRGPIYKFLLHACNSLSPNESLDISQWLTLLSEKGIKELYLQAYMFSRISISSELFNCPSLERVTLCNCEITCLDSHGSFGTLVYLNLDSVIISDEALELLISKFPLLETLALTFRACGRPFVANAPQLKALAFYSVMCSRPLCLSEFPSLSCPSHVRIGNSGEP